MRTLKDKLMARGLAAHEAAQWAALITTSFNTFRQAQKILKRHENWSKLLAKINPRTSTYETDLNDELYHKIKAIKVAAPIESILRDIHFESQPPIESAERTGKRSRRPDFSVTRFYGNGVFFEFAIEAKILLKHGDIRAEYLADGGIGCFITTDSPYTLSPVAAMLAYFFDETELYWKDKIKEKVGKSSLPLSFIDEVSIPGEIHQTLCTDLKRKALKMGDISVLHFGMKF